MARSRGFLGQYRIYVIPVVAAALMIGVSFTLLVPKAQEVFSMRENLEAKKDQVETLLNKKNLLESVNAASFVKTLQELHVALPAEKDAASILITLENVSAQSGFSIDSISFAPGIISTVAATTQPTGKAATDAEVTQRHGSSALAVTVKGRGTSSQFTQFIKTLPTARRLFDISKINASYFPDTPDFLSVDLDLFVYFLPAITQISSVESPISEITQAEQEAIATVTQYPDFVNMAIDTSSTASAVIGKSDLFSQ